MVSISFNFLVKVKGFSSVGFYRVPREIGFAFDTDRPIQTINGAFAIGRRDALQKTWKQ
jgi:hypothetical protein